MPMCILLVAMAVGVTLLPAPTAAAGRAVVEPLPMSAVTLKGEWKEKELRNQEVLLSLNMTQWACHFTTTANLTSCSADEAQWRTFVKNADNSFTEKLGFIGAGHDVRPPRNVTVPACKSFCVSTASCKGISFQLAEKDVNKTDIEVHCYWKTSVAGSFTPSPRSNCIAGGGTAKPSCAPLPGEMGLGGYYGHYQGHWMSATAFLYNTTGNETVKKMAADSINTFASVMAAWKAKYGYDGYLFPYDPLVWDKLLAGHGAAPYYTVPFYTLHKLMAGLLDQWHHAGNTQAYTMVQKMAEWVHGRVEGVINGPGGMDLWQRVLGTEWGGMNDVLYNLYEHTGNPLHLATARRFNAYVFTARLAAGQDDLSKLPFPHANFHLPEVVGMARAYEVTGNVTDKTIVDTFFNVLSTNHSYATGGSNSGECWQAARDLGNFLTSQTEESCTQYNVLKVARRRFMTSASASLADFYERAILNGIIGNQNTDDPVGATSYIYMQPLGGANVKPWGKSDYGFPCCWGTLSESFAKLGDSIFFWQPSSLGKQGNALYINQFVSSTVDLAGKMTGAVSVAQEAHFPIDATKTTTLTVTVPSSTTADFAIMIRVPSWAKSSKNMVTVNGKTVLGAPYKTGAYLRVYNQKWQNGDVVEVSFPMSLWTDPLNDYHAWHNATLAFMYGPLVLAGVHLETDIWVPHGGTKGAKADPSTFITRNSTKVLDFEAKAADGSKIQMIPLKDVMSERYVAYFMTAGTKPPQPHVYYCPHSARDKDYPFQEVPTHVCQDHVSAGPPSTPPGLEDATIKNRGVEWSLVNGALEHAPLTV